MHWLLVVNIFKFILYVAVRYYKYIILIHPYFLPDIFRVLRFVVWQPSVIKFRIFVRGEKSENVPLGQIDTQNDVRVNNSEIRIVNPTWKLSLIVPYSFRNDKNILFMRNFFFM